MPLVLALLIGVGFVPGVGPVYNLIAVAGEAQGTIPVLPLGEELGDEELLQVEGELGVIVGGALLFGFGALIGGIHEWFFDEEPGLDWNDAGPIILGGVAMAGGGVIGSFMILKMR